jgi:hypothetical protein
VLSFDGSFKKKYSFFKRRGTLEYGRVKRHLAIVGNVAAPQDIFDWWEWVLFVPDAPPGNHPGRGGNIFQQQNRRFFCQVCTIDTGTDLSRAYNNTPANSGQQIMIPVLTSEASLAENPNFTDAQLLSKARSDLSDPELLFLSVDNQYILTPRNALQYYVESNAGRVVVVGNNVLRIPPGPTRMRCVGYFVLLDPFQVGSGIHTITYGGSAGPAANRIQTLVSYEVTA